MNKFAAQNIGQFNNIVDFVRNKQQKFAQNKTMDMLFECMFDMPNNVMAEQSDGWRIKQFTYGECKQMVLQKATTLANTVRLPHDSLVGLYMENSLDWIVTFWAIVVCGYRPLLMNLRMQDATLEEILAEQNVQLVISDEKTFACRTILASDLPLCSGEIATFDHCGSEILFMSSGTTNKVKLCAYNAENLYYQVSNSLDIIYRCTTLTHHYQGKLKQLMLLPLYHMFGFMAVYLWFGFFSRTIVFLKDLAPATIQNTVKKHNVTHIFAVPMVWEKVSKAALAKIKEKGEKTYKKFIKGLKLANKSNFGQKLTHKAMAEVRESLFGESVCFLISGGSGVGRETLEFFNGIGYTLVNGFGMTEVGITSVEASANVTTRNRCSIGSPFAHTEYAISPNGELLIRGKNMAHCITQGDKVTNVDPNEWFNSNDLACCHEGRYYMLGRRDDLVVSRSGENLNPTIIEGALKFEGADEFCLVDADGDPTLVISAKNLYSQARAQSMLEDAKKQIAKLNLHNEIRNFVLTTDKLIEDKAIKISRRGVAKRLKSGSIAAIDTNNVQNAVEEILDDVQRQLVDVFAQTLHLAPAKIGLDMNFFSDLGGTSLDYFMLADVVESRYGVDIKNANGKTLYTVNDVYLHIKNK